MGTVHTAITEPVRRLEVFTGAGRRRKWSGEDKVRIAAEVVASGEGVFRGSTHGLSPPQLFGWRRQSREAAGGHSEADEVQFVPAVVVDALVPAPVLTESAKAVRNADSGISAGRRSTTA